MIPANDDATKSIVAVVDAVVGAVAEGLNERKSDKAAATKDKEEASAEEAPAKEAAAEKPPRKKPKRLLLKQLLQQKPATTRQEA